MHELAASTSGTSRRERSPWSWIPTLYIAEGLPYVAVNILTVMIYTGMGVGTARMAFYTGWLYLPWVVKPFWSPFVDMFGTKRGWTVAMEWLIAAMTAGVAFTLPGPWYFGATLALFWLMAFFSATHDIAADGFYMLALTSHDQATYVGVRSTFYRVATVLGQGGLVVLAGWLEKKTGTAGAWSAVFGAMAVFFAAVALYHHFFLPRPSSDRPMPGVTPRTVISDFGKTFVTFFAKPGIWGALAFMLLYRLPEALCLKLVIPFLQAPRSEGGLALDTAQVGIANGTVGVIALLAGGITGGVAIGKGGLKKWLWPMAAALALPCFLYCLLAMWQPHGFAAICTAIGVEQFGYGFGFTAYMLYLIYFSRGESQTTHYAFCTAFMALGMMLPGMAAGWIHEALSSSVAGDSAPAGYVKFFWCVTACCVATFAACACVKIDPGFGKKK